MCYDSFLVLAGAGIGYLLGKKQGRREGEQTKLENKSCHSFSLDKGEESTPLSSAVETEINGLEDFKMCSKPLN
ncbi:MAG: hypothetical protein IIT66_03215 [Acetobacter sp.]|nr:hypothetical protein [Acetobacter sp.]MBQ5479207.1 hypothetical protein [Acetobacter sp.]